jgi:hypothetical protein
MNQPTTTIQDILAVAGGNKEFVVSLNKQDAYTLGITIFVAMLIAIVLGGIIVKKLA